MTAKKLVKLNTTNLHAAAKGNNQFSSAFNQLMNQNLIGKLTLLY